MTVLSQNRHASTLWALCWIGIIALAGCATTTEYSPHLVTPPENGVVLTVIPANTSPAQTDWASYIQKCLLWDNQRVIERPPLDQTETTSTSAEDEEDRPERKTDITVDVVAAYAKSEADIIVASDSGFRRLKFIDRRNQNQILLSRYVPVATYDKPDSTCQQIRDGLVRIGLFSNPQ